MTSLFLADDHIALRDSLANMLEGKGGFKVTGTAANGKDTIAAFENDMKADVLLLDINMPGMDGYDTAAWMKKHRPNVEILIYSMYDAQLSMIRLLQIGIRGILKKDVSLDILFDAIRAVAAGIFYYGESATAEIAAYFKRDENGVSPMDKAGITDREIEFIRLCATDLTYKEVADRMGLTIKANEVMRQGLFDKLDVHSRVGLVIEGVKAGVVKF